MGNVFQNAKIVYPVEFGTSIVIIAIIVSVILVIRNKSKKRRQKEQETEKNGRHENVIIY